MTWTLNEISNTNKQITDCDAEFHDRLKMIVTNHEATIKKLEELRKRIYEELLRNHEVLGSIYKVHREIYAPYLMDLYEDTFIDQYTAGEDEVFRWMCLRR